MMEDHAWAGDKRHIPPGGTLMPSKSQEIMIPLEYEAGGDDASKDAASTSNDAMNMKKTLDDQQEEASGMLLMKKTLDDRQEEASGTLLMKYTLDDQMGEASGSLMKKKTSDDQKEEAGGSLMLKKSSGDQKEETDGAILSKSTLDDQKGEASGVMIKRKSTLDDQEGEASGALLLKKTKWQGQVWSPRRMMDRSEVEKIESKAKEGVGQSLICSGHDRNLTVGKREKLFFILLSRAGYSYSHERFS